MKRKFGWIPQLPDHRDLKLTSFRKLPESMDMRDRCSAVVDQGELGSCTANAIAGAYDFEHLRENLGEFTPSRLFIYYNERKMEGTIKTDSGAVIRDGFKTINKDGVCSESEWPYIIRKFASKPCKKCYNDAKKDQVLQYMAIQQTPAQLKGCLADGFPFIFGFTVYSSFMNIGSAGIMTMPLEGDSVEGGHAVMCVGYNDADKEYIVRNSWGNSWGSKGYFYMPYDYMHDPDLCSDFWVVKKVE